MPRLNLRLFERWSVLILLVWAPPVFGASSWRFWTRADGLSESVIFGLTSGGPGRLVVKLGDVPDIDSLDGYQISTVPGPHVLGRLLEASGDELWSFDADGIEVRDPSGWHKYPVPEIAAFARAGAMLQVPWFMYSVNRGPDERMDLVPFGKETALIMFPDRLVEWNRGTRRGRIVRLANETSLSRFRDMREAAGGGYWLTGNHGIARLKKAGSDIEWSEFPPPPNTSELLNPMEGADGEVFVSALRRDGKRALFLHRGSHWKQIYVGDKGQLRGWRGPEGAIWVQDERRIIELTGNPLRDSGAGHEITGLTTAVVSEPDRAFWLATTEGLARYSPPLWRTPPEGGWADGAVSAIDGDSSGRVWFLSADYLMGNDHGKWNSYRLPAGPRETLLTDNLLVLDNGDLAIRGNSLAQIVVFSPRSGKFRLVQSPRGSRIGWMAKRRTGGLWVQVFDGDSRWHLDAFDGAGFFHTRQSLPLNIPDLKAILETRNGDIWLGGTDSLNVVHGDRLTRIAAKDGFTDTGVFSAIQTRDGRVLLGGRDHITEYAGGHFRVLHDVDLAESLCEGSDGVIWIGSGSGVHRYLRGRWITNNTDDGLPTPAVRKVYADFDNRVWAGTGRGISLLHPEADPDPPMTRIVDDRNLRQTPPGGDVRLTFSGIDKWKFTPPERLLFSWRMDGSPWSDFDSSQFASFTGLRSGSHRFEVRSMDRNGNIDPAPAQYSFAVLVPWYEETEFLVLASLALGLIAVLGRFAWRHEHRLEFQSRHDPLTGLANRAEFEERFQRAIALARADGTHVAMILLDLDRFKPINDTLGHEVGDLFLQEVSSRLKTAVRRQDTLARLGGDEFAIVMPGLRTSAEAEWMAEDILHKLRQPYYIESFELAGSASIGISLFPEHADDAGALQRLADMAMYRCKARNKDEYAVFDPEINRVDFRSAEMAGLIREALEKGYFAVRYQPVMTARGSLAGFEALVRLEHPRFGSLQPAEFIPIAEDTGLIRRIGDWVLRQACAQMVNWQAAGHRGFRIAVNVSTLQVKRPDFAETVESILRATGLDPHSLTLEITETAMMRNWEQSRTQMKRLRSLGVRFALDDFGTGYSTLNSLQLLPVDFIKIDRAFIERISDTADGLVVIQAVVELAHRLGFRVIAEGVESGEQLSGLTAIGCDLVQGFLLGSPLTSDEIEKLFLAPDAPEAIRVLARRAAAGD